MKTIISIFSFCFALTLFGQSSNRFVRFKVDYFLNAFKSKDSKIETIIVDSKLDVNFYKKHFNIPPHFPKLFIDYRFKDTIIVAWADSSKEKDFKSNWTFTTKYDSQSRVITYDYSGCMVCGQMRYHIALFYDTKSRLVKIESEINSPLKVLQGRVYKSDEPKKPDEEYYFKYDNEANIIQVKQYRLGLLEQQIDKM